MFVLFIAFDLSRCGWRPLRGVEVAFRPRLLCRASCASLLTKGNDPNSYKGIISSCAGAPGVERTCRWPVSNGDLSCRGNSQKNSPAVKGPAALRWPLEFARRRHRLRQRDALAGGVGNTGPHQSAPVCNTSFIRWSSMTSSSNTRRRENFRPDRTQSRRGRRAWRSVTAECDDVGRLDFTPARGNIPRHEHDGDSR
jgi:hypothetical protein